MTNRRVLLLLLLGLGACDRLRGDPRKSSTASENASAIDASVTTNTSAARTPSAAGTAVVDASVSVVDAGPAPLATVEKLAVTKCPARMAVVKLEKRHGFEGRVELTGCPDDDENLRGAGKARLTLVDGNGVKKQEVDLSEGEYHSERIEVEDLYGTGRPVFFVTVTEPSMGSWGGPTTSLFELDGGRLVPLQVVVKDGGVEPISLVSALNVHWWLHPARSGRGQDLYEIRSSADGKDTGFRYVFEIGRWTVRSGPLKRWTGEHLKDTEAEFR